MVFYHACGSGLGGANCPLAPPPAPVHLIFTGERVGHLDRCGRGVVHQKLTLVDGNIARGHHLVFVWEGFKHFLSAINFLFVKQKNHSSML